jgi:hypothetical protein
MVLRVKKAVRRLVPRPEVLEQSGAATQADWDAMISRMDAQDREAERRLAQAERALNRLTLS